MEVIVNTVCNWLWPKEAGDSEQSVQLWLWPREESNSEQL